MFGAGAVGLGLWDWGCAVGLGLGLGYIRSEHNVVCLWAWRVIVPLDISSLI